VSNHHGHNTLEQVSQIADLETVLPSAEQIQQRITQAKQTPDDKPVLVVALDGAHAPTRPRGKRKGKRGPGKWREVKGVRLYLAPKEGRVIQVASWHQIQDAEAMKADIKAIAARIPQEQVRVALLGDGAAWVWNTLAACFPEGKPVLDYYHCSEHVHKVGQTPSVRIIMETLQKPSNGLRRLWHDYPKTRWTRSSGDSSGFRPKGRTRRKWTS